MVRVGKGVLEAVGVNVIVGVGVSVGSAAAVWVNESDMP